LLAVAIDLALSLPTRAQAPLGQASHAREQAQGGSQDQDNATRQPAELDLTDPNEVDMADVDINNLDCSQLNVDSSKLAYGPAKVAAGRHGPTKSSEMNWSANGKPNGAPFWDPRIGADMTVAREPSTMSELVAEKAANGGAAPQSSGSA
jgi:hypothetical protein